MATVFLFLVEDTWCFFLIPVHSLHSLSRDSLSFNFSFTPFFFQVKDTDASQSTGTRGLHIKLIKKKEGQEWEDAGDRIEIRGWRKSEASGRPLIPFRQNQRKKGPAESLPLSVKSTARGRDRLMEKSERNKWSERREGILSHLPFYLQSFYSRAEKTRKRRKGRQENTTSSPTGTGFMASSSVHIIKIARVKSLNSR